MFETFNSSKIGKYFELEARGTNITTEFRGAVATFLTMAYILAVNPSILATSGGSCDGSEGDTTDEYQNCLIDIRRQFIVSTAICSMIGTLTMGVWANLPIALSCGMGMNAYFTFSVVGFHGFGNVTYGAALVATLIEGVVFLVLSLTGARSYIIKWIPEPVRLATPAAIGAFLAHLGLQTAEGLGIVVGDIATAVTLGGCSEENRVSLVAYTEDCKDKGFCNLSDNYTCDDLGGVMESGTAWIGILGTLIIVILLAYKVKSAFIIGILFVTFISWFRGTAVTYFMDNTAGNARFEYFKQVVSVEPLDKIFAKYDFSEASGSDFASALVTLLYVDFLDTSGTLLAIVSSMDLVDENGDFKNSRAAYATDALATILGSLFGLSPLTSYIESAAGVEAGSRTGLTSVFCAFFFFLSIFFAPILASIPPWATGGSLIIVGSLMARNLTKIKWSDPCHAFTAFVTVIMMPLTYSIAYGLIAGIGSWLVFQSVFFICEKGLGIVNPTTEKKKDDSPDVYKDDSNGVGADA